MVDAREATVRARHQKIVQLVPPMPRQDAADAEFANVVDDALGETAGRLPRIIIAAILKSTEAGPVETTPVTAGVSAANAAEVASSEINVRARRIMVLT